ncbi:MAG: T9SS type A sorting domain-containing protein, partial [Bacteroidota bacterium]
SNGDGFISAADTIGIVAHYGQHSNISIQEVLSEKDDVLTLVPSSTTLEEGKVVTIDVYLGDVSKPVIDRHGIAFAVQLPTTTINRDSVEFIPNTAWFGEGSHTISLSETRNGRLEVGMTRTGNQGISGDGLLGTMRITGVEDIDGWRPGDEETDVILDVESVVVDGAGRKYRVQTTPLELTFLHQIEASPEQTQPEVVVYPNPSANFVEFFANGDDTITSIFIYDVAGRSVTSKVGINASSYRLTHQLDSGVYVAQVQTALGQVNEMIQVSK